MNHGCGASYPNHGDTSNWNSHTKKGSTMDIEQLRIVKAARERRCKARTAKGLLRYIKRNHMLLKAEVKWTDKKRTNHHRTSLEVAHRNAKKNRELGIMFDDSDYADTVLAEVRTKYPRLRAWGDGQHVIRQSLAGQKVTETDWSSRWPRTVHDFTYHSRIFLAKHGMTAEIWQGGKLVKKISAPSGMHFENDTLGRADSRFAGTSDGNISNGLVVVCNTSRAEYHPTARELKARDYKRRLRQGLLNAKKRDREIKREERERARESKKKNAHMNRVRVTLQDSLDAGNCLAGSLAFISKVLGIPRRAVMNPDKEVSVLGKELIKTGHSLAIRAVEHAWRREQKETA